MTSLCASGKDWPRVTGSRRLGARNPRLLSLEGHWVVCVQKQTRGEGRDLSISGLAEVAIDWQWLLCCSGMHHTVPDLESQPHAESTASYRARLPSPPELSIRRPTNRVVPAPSSIWLIILGDAVYAKSMHLER